MSALDDVLAALVKYPELGAWGTPADYSILVRQDQPVGSGSSQYKVETLAVPASSMLARLASGDIVARTFVEVLSDLGGATSGHVHEGTVIDSTGVTDGYVLTADGADGSVWEAAAGGGAVDSVFGRTGVVAAVADDYTWAQIDKATSSIADIATRNHTDLAAGDGSDHSFIDQSVVSGAGPSFTSAVLTTPRVSGTTIIRDDSTSQKMLVLGNLASAVNYPQLVNSATGNDVVMSAQGTDTNINLRIEGKGTGIVSVGSDLSMGSNSFTAGHLLPTTSGMYDIGKSAGGYWNNLFITGDINDGVTAFNVDKILLTDGTRPLTADWDAGSFEIRAEAFRSDVLTGTAPFTVASTTAVANLNASLLEGKSAPTGAIVGTTDTQTLMNKTLTSAIIATELRIPVSVKCSFGDAYIWENPSKELEYKADTEHRWVLGASERMRLDSGMLEVLVPIRFRGTASGVAYNVTVSGEISATSGGSPVNLTSLNTGKAGPASFAVAGWWNVYNGTTSGFIPWCV